MRHVFIFTSTAMLLISALQPSSLLAGGEDDILRPVPFSMHAGPYAGGAWISSHGTFETLCDCEYSAGDGFGFHFGAFVDYPLSRSFSLLATAGFRSLRPVYDKQQSRLEYIQYSPEFGDFTRVDYELETIVQLSMIELGVFGKWELPVRGLYVAAGPELALVVDDNIEETERILTPGIGYDTNGGTEQVSLDDPLSRIYDDTGYRFAIGGKLGYVIAITQRLAVAPELSISIPVTGIASEYPDWQLSAVQAQVYLRFAL